MKVLGIETSHQEPQIGLMIDGTSICERLSDPGGRQPARNLLPALDRFLKANRIRANELDLIAIDIGPGSFTGLRIAVTAVKTLAYVTHTPVIAIGSLELSLRSVPQLQPYPRVAVVDAQRRMVYSLRHQTADQTPCATYQSIEMRTVADVAEELKAGGTLTGPASDLVRRTAEKINVCTTSCPDVQLLMQQARERFEQNGEGEDVLKLVPWYVRKSAAEEKAEADDQ